MTRQPQFGEELHGGTADPTGAPVIRIFLSLV